MENTSVEIMIGFGTLFILGIYIAYLWARSYALTLAAIKEFISVPPHWAYLLLVPFFNFIWICFLTFYINNGLRKMHAAGRMSQIHNGGLIFAIALIISLFTALAFPSLWGVVFIFYIFTWIKVAEARRYILKPA